MHVTGKWQNRLQLHEILIAFKGSFQSVQLFHLLCELLKADTMGRRVQGVQLHSNYYFRQNCRCKYLQTRL